MKTLHFCHLTPALLVALLLPLALTSKAAEGDTLQRCRAVAEAAARLACYDALPLAAPLVAAAATAATAAAVTPPAPSMPAARAVLPAGPGFGLSRQDDAAVVSHIPGLFEGWSARTRITLANGQVWQVVDDSLGVYDLKDAKVTVRRALLGGYVMDITGANRMPRVQRLQ